MRLLLAFFFTGFLLLATSGCGPESEHAMHHGSDTSPTARQAEVAARGAVVMPFDLERTVHVFEETEDGGLQQVLVKDTADREQIALIRSHLREEAARFARGDFSDPARIHGEAMPGLRDLADGAARIEVRYAELPEGAQIRYTTTDSSLVRAVHQWFAAQRSDHGRHARAH